MPTSEELEAVLETLMEDLHDRAGTGGKSDEDVEAGDGDHQ